MKLPRRNSLKYELQSKLGLHSLTNYLLTQLMGPTTPQLLTLGHQFDAAKDQRLPDTVIKKLLTILTKGPYIKRSQGICAEQGRNPSQRKQSNLRSYGTNMSVMNGCLWLCLDEQMAISKALMDAVVEGIHSTHPGSFSMLSWAKNICWP